MASRPNIVVIQTDQHRADGFGLAGNPVLRTPAIDRLAREGAVFDRAYVQSPLCMPSRASLFTGQYLGGHGVWTNGVPLREDIPTLATMLSDIGYATASVGKLHFTPYNMPPYPPGRGDPPAFVESFHHWAHEGDRLDKPYYGLQSVQLTLGHNMPAGHYGDWLARHHPEALDLFGPDRALAAPTGAMQSWRSALPVECHSSTWVGDTAVTSLRELAAGDTPFFLWVSFPDPHHPFAPPEPYASMYDPADIPTPVRRQGELDDKPEHFRRCAQGGVLHDGAFPADRPGTVTDDQIREIIAHTYGMISLVDHNVGKVLDELDRLGLTEDTIVIFTSDHGELLGDHGLLLKGPFMYESLIKVPLIVRWPRLVRPGRTDALVGHIDVVPTLAELAGFEADVPGRSFSGLLRDPGSPPPRAALVVEYYSGYWPELTLTTLCTPRWKLTAYPDSETGELYDLDEDPDEFTNLYHDPAHSELRASLTEQLAAEAVGIEEPRAPKYAHA